MNYLQALIAFVIGMTAFDANAQNCVLTDQGNDLRQRVYSCDDGYGHIRLEDAAGRPIETSPRSPAAPHVYADPGSAFVQGQQAAMQQYGSLLAEHQAQLKALEQHIRTDAPQMPNNCAQDKDCTARALAAWKSYVDNIDRQALQCEQNSKCARDAAQVMRAVSSNAAEVQFAWGKIQRDQQRPTSPIVPSGEPSRDPSSDPQFPLEAAQCSQTAVHENAEASAQKAAYNACLKRRGWRVD